MPCRDGRTLQARDASTTDSLGGHYTPPSLKYNEKKKKKNLSFDRYAMPLAGKVQDEWAPDTGSYM